MVYLDATLGTLHYGDRLFIERLSVRAPRPIASMQAPSRRTLTAPPTVGVEWPSKVGYVFALTSQEDLNMPKPDGWVALLRDVVRWPRGAQLLSLRRRHGPTVSPRRD